MSHAIKLIVTENSTIRMQQCPVRSDVDLFVGMHGSKHPLEEDDLALWDLLRQTVCHGTVERTKITMDKEVGNILNEDVFGDPKWRFRSTTPPTRMVGLSGDLERGAQGLFIDVSVRNV